MSDSSLLCEAEDFNGLETAVWELACSWGRRKLEAYLRHLDRKLMAERSPGLRHVGVRERTLVTRMGEVVLRRAYYVDLETGRYRYLLDEALKLPPRERASRGFKAEAVAQAAEESFRRAARAMGDKVSHSSVHRWLWELGAAFRRQVEASRRRVFGAGEVLKAAVGTVAALFCEADGVVLHLQREARKLIEAKLAVMHAGWRRLHPSGGGFRLKDKLVYAAIQDGRRFWESLSVVAGRRWDLSAVKVIGGDGADWVKEGLDYFAGAVYQLCRFHLARKIRECLRGRALARVFAVRHDPARLLEEAREAVAAASDPEARRRARELLDYLLANREGLEDYRRRVKVEGVELRGLGGIEGNADKVISDRMKKRGMAWVVEGARNMLGVLTLKSNGWLEATAQAVWGPGDPEPAGGREHQRRPGGGSSGVRVAHPPILDSGRGLARVLRRVINPSISL